MPKPECGDYRANTCLVTLELSWDAAKILARYGPALIEAFVAQVAARTDYDAEREKERAEVTRRSKRRLKWYQTIVPSAARELRRLGDPTGCEPSLIGPIAARHQVSPSALQYSVRKYRRIVRTRVRRRRDWTIVQLSLDGLTNSQIANEVGLHRQTVAIALRREKPRIIAERRARFQAIVAPAGHTEGLVDD